MREWGGWVSSTRSSPSRQNDQDLTSPDHSTRTTGHSLDRNCFRALQCAQNQFQDWGLWDRAATWFILLCACKKTWNTKLPKCFINVFQKWKVSYYIDVYRHGHKVFFPSLISLSIHSIFILTSCRWCNICHSPVPALLSFLSSREKDAPSFLPPSQSLIHSCFLWLKFRGFQGSVLQWGDSGCGGAPGLWKEDCLWFSKPKQICSVCFLTELWQTLISETVKTLGIMLLLCDWHIQSWSASYRKSTREFSSLVCLPLWS